MLSLTLQQDTSALMFHFNERFTFKHIFYFTPSPGYIFCYLIRKLDSNVCLTVEICLKINNSLLVLSQ